MTDPLDDLAAEGRSRRERAGDAEKRAQSDEDRAADREKRSRLWASTSAYALWLWWVWPTLATVAIGVASYFADGRKHEESDLSGLAVLAAIPLFGLAWMLRGTFGRRAVARNQAKLRALPFSVGGYVGALSRNTTEGTAKIVVHFAPRRETKQRDDVGFRDAGAVASESIAADETTLADAFFAIGAKIEKEPRKDGARVFRWEIRSGESSFWTNSHLDDFIWRAIAVLEAIHARHPITSVEIEGFG